MLEQRKDAKPAKGVDESSSEEGSPAHKKLRTESDEPDDGAANGDSGNEGGDVNCRGEVSNSGSDNYQETNQENEEEDHSPGDDNVPRSSRREDGSDTQNLDNEDDLFSQSEENHSGGSDYEDHQDEQAERIDYRDPEKADAQAPQAEANDDQKCEDGHNHATRTVHTYDRWFRGGYQLATTAPGGDTDDPIVLNITNYPSQHQEGGFGPNAHMGYFDHAVEGGESKYDLEKDKFAQKLCHLLVRIQTVDEW